MEDEVVVPADDEQPIATEPMTAENEQTKPLKKVRRRKLQLFKNLRDQMEFYFGDSNLMKDRFLSQLLQTEGSVDLSVFLRFNRIRSLTSSIEDIANALKISEMLVLTEDGTKVYRKTPVKIKENEEDCTIYVEQLPPDANHEWLKKIFSSYGDVVYVSIPKYKPSNKIKGFAFVEFDTPDAASKTLEAFGEMGCRLPAQMPPDNLCSIVTFEQENQEKNIENDSDVCELPVFEEELEGNVRVEPKQAKKRKISSENCEQDDEKVALGDCSPNKKKKKKILQEPKAKTVTVVDLEESNGDSEVVGGSDEATGKETLKSNIEVDLETKEGTEDEVAEVMEEKNGEDENVDRKKKRRHRKKNKSKPETDPCLLGLQILSKREWRRLRNKYLDLQRSKMKAVKQHLARMRWANSGRYGWGTPSQGFEEIPETIISEQKPTVRTSFTPGVIIHLQLDTPISDVKKFKSEVKVHQGIEYIDVTEGAKEAYLRCSNCQVATQLVSEKPWPQVTVLSGKEENEYWEKIKRDREEKIGSKVRVKQRGRDKLIKKAERELGKHIRFDE